MGRMGWCAGRKRGDARRGDETSLGSRGERRRRGEEVGRAARRREVEARTNVSRETSARTPRSARNRTSFGIPCASPMRGFHPNVANPGPCGPVPFRSGAFPQVALRRVASFRPRCRKHRNIWVKTARRRSGREGSTGEGMIRTGESERMFHVKHRSPLFVVLGRSAIGSRDAWRPLPTCRPPVEHAPHHLVTRATCNRHVWRTGARYDRFNNN